MSSHAPHGAGSGTRSRTQAGGAPPPSSSGRAAGGGGGGGGGPTSAGAADEVPAFILTLLQLVEDPATQHLCSWADDGNTFLVHDPDG